METAFDYALLAMERAFARVELMVPPPVPMRLGRGFVFRYQERTLHQAIVLKLAAVISRLRASSVLLKEGYVNEQAVMHRLIDEINEDVLFLVLAETNDSITPLHQRFLDAFFAEEFSDPNDIVRTRKDRDIVPRRKIRAYIARIAGATGNPHMEIETDETIGKMYSGFVHGAAMFVLELYGGLPPKFHLSGMLGTPILEEHRRDSWNYHYRSLLSFVGAAKAFGDAELLDFVKTSISEFERISGRT